LLYKVNLAVRDRYRSVVMHWAAANGNKGTIQELFEKTNIDVKDYFGRKAQHWAAENDHQDIVELLLGTQAEPNTLSLRRLFSLSEPN
jgi:ankyrin repeat protein